MVPAAVGGSALGGARHLGGSQWWWAIFENERGSQIEGQGRKQGTRKSDKRQPCRTHDDRTQQKIETPRARVSTCRPDCLLLPDASEILFVPWSPVGLHRDRDCCPNAQR